MAMVINTIRAGRDANLNDSTTAFLEGFAFGPIGILSGLNPQEHAIGRGTPRMIGGTVGTIAAYFLYKAI